MMALMMQFQPDVRLLNAAGIDTYFSNGNAGPDFGTVGSPASFPESFGVGAVDDTELIAGFSSRGPSPWGDLKPQVVAPGDGDPVERAGRRLSESERHVDGRAASGRYRRAACDRLCRA